MHVLSRPLSRTVRSCRSCEPGEFGVAFGHTRTVADGLPDAATLLKQCERRRLIAIGARRRSKQRKRLGLAIPVFLGAAQRKTFVAERHGLLVTSEQSRRPTRERKTMRDAPPITDSTKAVDLENLGGTRRMTES